ncbi:beta-1,4-N-acetylgalactosaminyltransferase bre-4 [Drosophila guanche]|uniref:Blast:Beta-1,4-N-acetylgalactosaminyltransferase bre-4 n=1 Tax=Drosophila guanche TaxID=7266 RepID=A0A3B0JH12_DROGU|nr:beta-1,4-N-acetylgalactosaminyltransferase bre-4 [Drosophila guanche]SPP74660.1 blast:Beta-1%2C4-N-acetylgalactosaminyltransferase bre-4 [Drosophila guanche]
MIVFTKANLIRFLAGAICLLLVLNFVGFRTDGASSTSLSKLSIRRVHKYAHIHRNASASGGIRLPAAPLALSKERELHNAQNSTSTTVIAIANFTSIPKDLSHPFANINSTNMSTHKPLPMKPTMSALHANCTDPDPRDGGPITPNTTLESLDVIEAELGPLLRPGGAFQPDHCNPQHHVAIVVPFRDRYAHLSVFLRNIHPFLMKQRIAYRIFIVEQTNGKPFNRAAMMNIGYLEALKLYQWDCFIFHDVDLLPLDDRNLYNCPRQPRHMSVAIDTLNFKLPYRTIFGGVSAMTREHFQAVNGFSNSFFGWGGEDDDMSNRLKHANLFISRYPVNIARYKMLKHQKEKANPKRYENIQNGMNKIEMDGINSIKYAIYSIKEFPTFTWYLAELRNSERKS